ncbi:MAG: enoyl-CoA hydratase/isomerase family protein [Pseudomonadales bacterium]
MSQPSNDAAAPLLLFEHATRSGHVLAEARLNSEPTLNALSLPMIEILGPAMSRWAADPAVVAVLLTGAGDRAFSAGGDIQALYRAIVKNHAAGRVADDYPFRFFEQEYRLDYQIHTFAKPVISLGHGVVMGGGLGIFSGADYRIVTEKSRIALPEVTIGLFPDAGATWLLRNMPTHLATFLGVTGAHMNGADALATGVATHQIAAAQRPDVLAGLLALAWQGQTERDGAAIADCLEQLPRASLPERQVDQVPESLHPRGAILEVAERVRALAGRSPWIDAAIAAMDRGCPTSVGIVVEQLRRAPSLDLADCFRLEMVVATHCARHPDFAEGVRALIIDKDNQPRWRFASIEALPESYVAEHFEPPWSSNPLDNIEETTA